MKLVCADEFLEVCNRHTKAGKISGANLNNQSVKDCKSHQSRFVKWITIKVSFHYPVRASQQGLNNRVGCHYNWFLNKLF